ncbi:MAG TPA: amidohydrolase family protein [Actinomycetota bacterium]|nr:amidohydrolase family protein [Actinomycetota bacterium]
MPKAIDLHVHLPTDEWLDNAIGPMLPATEAYFRKSPERRSLDQVAEEYRDQDVLGVVLDWDDESVTGRGWLGNDFMAALPERYPGVLMGFGSVDPHHDDAVQEVDRIADLGLKGLKFHPTMQRFDPGDEAFYPIYERMQERGLIALFHTGTCGIGAGTPGASGTKIRYSHPGFLDSVGADFPGIDWIAAHFGWPWTAECLALALHKSNVWIELSGWAPGYLPPEVKREIGKRLNRQTLFGSDYPFIPLDRWFSEFDELGLPDDAAERILKGNASQLLGLGS